MRRIICLGDSNTYGYDPCSYVGSRYPEEVRWTELLRDSETEVINCGQNGLCIPTESQYSLYRALVQRYVPVDTIIIMLGSNDLLEGENLDEISEKMAGFAQFLKELVPNTDVILVSPPTMQYGEWVPTQELIERSDQLGRVYSAISGRMGIRFADANDWNVTLTYDGVHFTEEGHMAFASGISKKLKKNTQY
ncbi:MAG: lipase [Oscillospiraceae bacterium]|nr:lipase [Oscillospiraceae bacterium]